MFPSRFACSLVSLDLLLTHGKHWTHLTHWTRILAHWWVIWVCSFLFIVYTVWNAAPTCPLQFLLSWCIHRNNKAIFYLISYTYFLQKHTVTLPRINSRYGICCDVQRAQVRNFFTETNNFHIKFILQQWETIIHLVSYIHRPISSYFNCTV